MSEAENLSPRNGSFDSPVIHDEDDIPVPDELPPPPPVPEAAAVEQQIDSALSPNPNEFVAESALSVAPTPTVEQPSETIEAAESPLLETLHADALVSESKSDASSDASISDFTAESIPTDEPTAYEPTPSSSNSLSSEANNQAPRTEESTVCEEKEPSEPSSPVRPDLSRPTSNPTSPNIAEEKKEDPELLFVPTSSIDEIRLVDQKRNKIGRLTIVHPQSPPSSPPPERELNSPPTSPPPASLCFPSTGSATTSPTTTHTHHRTTTKVSGVTDVQRTLHVTYDEKSGKYLGVPKEWEDALKKQFGLPITLCDKEIGADVTKLYPKGVPRVLSVLKSHLMRLGGATQTGIFRLAPDGKESDRIKESLNNSQFEACDLVKDANVFSNLIKVWFRDLPSPLLGSLDLEEMGKCSTEEEAFHMANSKLKEPNRSVYLWLLDLCTDISAHSEVNKMTAKNLSIVIAPNLTKPPDVKSTRPEDAVKALQLSKNVNTFVELCIAYRERNKPQ